MWSGNSAPIDHLVLAYIRRTFNATGKLQSNERVSSAMQTDYRLMQDESRVTNAMAGLLSENKKLKQQIEQLSESLLTAPSSTSVPAHGPHLPSDDEDESVDDDDTEEESADDDDVNDDTEEVSDDDSDDADDDTEEKYDGYDDVDDVDDDTEEEYEDDDDTEDEYDDDDVDGDDSVVGEDSDEDGSNDDDDVDGNDSVVEDDSDEDGSNDDDDVDAHGSHSQPDDSWMDDFLRDCAQPQPFADYMPTVGGFDFDGTYNASLPYTADPLSGLWNRHNTYVAPETTYTMESTTNVSGEERSLSLKLSKITTSSDGMSFATMELTHYESPWNS